jgi:hypothetical protein
MTTSETAIRRGLETVQRAHDLTEALTAARKLQARLEMLGDRAADVAVVRSLCNSLARDLAALAR